MDCMKERRATIRRVSRPRPRPSSVLATQNPSATEATYPLAEAQLDRFLFKLRVRYPAVEELIAIIDRTTQVHAVSVERVMTGPAVLGFRVLIREVPLASHVRDFASTIVMATHAEWEGSP